MIPEWVHKYPSNNKHQVENSTCEEPKLWIAMTAYLLFPRPQCTALLIKKPQEQNYFSAHILLSKRETSSEIFIINLRMDPENQYNY